MRRTISLFRNARIALFNKGGVEEIFKHMRNLITASLVLSAGLFAVGNEASLERGGIFDISAAGYFVAFIGGLLFLINLLDGLWKLAKYREHIILQFLLIGIYLLITLPLAEVMLNFQTG